MKKIILTLLVGLATLCTSAQGFQPEIRVGYELGVDHDKNQSFGAEFIAGYRITPTFRLGAGVGVSYVDLLFEDANVSAIGSHIYYSKEYRESAVSVPIFVNAKVNFFENSISPFFTANIGYNAYIACSDYAKNNKLGFFVAPAVGTDFNIGKGAITLQVGYKYQMRTCDLWSNTNGNYSQVTFAVGYQF
jgi:hypothetical protein